MEYWLSDLDMLFNSDSYNFTNTFCYQLFTVTKYTGLFAATIDVQLYSDKLRLCADDLAESVDLSLNMQLFPAYDNIC